MTSSHADQTGRPVEPPKEPPQPGYVKCHYCHGTGKVTYHGAELAVCCEACGGSGTLARSAPR